MIICVLHHINGNCVLVGPPSVHQKSISSCYASLSDYEAFSQNFMVTTGIYFAYHKGSR